MYEANAPANQFNRAATGGIMATIARMKATITKKYESVMFF